MRTILRAENYATHEAARFALALHLAAEFADTEETEAGMRQQTAAVETECLVGHERAHLPRRMAPLGGSREREYFCTVWR